MEQVNDYKERLVSIFQGSSISEKQIDEVIDIVLNNSDNNIAPFENQIEIMTDLLLESGDSCLSKKGESSSGAINTYFTNNYANILDENEEGAVGFAHTTYGLTKTETNSLLTLFPDICPKFLDCFVKRNPALNFDEIVNELSEIDYVKREVDPLDMWEDLKEMLPNADPTYLRNQARVLAKRPLEDYEEFLKNAIEKNDYPTLQDYLRKQEKLEDISVYTEKFTVANYLKIIPNPVEFFTDPEREAILADSGSSKSDEEFALNFLYNQFPYLRQNQIQKIFNNYGKHLIKTCNKLTILPRDFRKPRKYIEQNNECFNVKLLQEIAFLKHETSIRRYVKMKNDTYRKALEEARKYGLLKTCLCCFDEELIPEECLFCDKNCSFCKNCVKLGAEHVIGEGRTKFPCLADCPSEFNYSVLKMVLHDKVFKRLCQRKQIEEIKSANIDGLETCPFCDFSMVPKEGDKIFKCGNIECMKESCRECRHVAHIPLKCSEIEYDEDVKMRTYIENEMSEALLRTCWKCSKKFYKESGCNKMTCLCGAKMCYVCGVAVQDYSHFGSGRCPLYTENLDQFHFNNVIQRAQAAKTTLGVDKNPNKLKFDPTKNFNLK
ncbi:E3 ubiquitin-protein ligase RNF216-like [Tribolium madens]|uniref:E3 ubiquitin-protein ligase RNF216-like n=1 Tax=Tribolium madens TaxID=41895 RepID=UPI001CF726BA|nr:E3 ubiquitin-protein ligase RNF216-like [Tribolium madens]